MKQGAAISGRFFVVMSKPTSPTVWVVYDKEGSYVETFCGSPEAARVRLNQLDLTYMSRQESKDVV